MRRGNVEKTLVTTACRKKLRLEVCESFSRSEEPFGKKVRPFKLVRLLTQISQDFHNALQEKPAENVEIFTKWRREKLVGWFGVVDGKV